MRALFTAIVLSANLCLAQTHYFTTIYAGTVPPLANPVALKQYLDYPCAVTYDAHGNLYYSNNTQVWRLNPDGTDTLIAGQPFPPAGVPVIGPNNGLAINAMFDGISALAFDSQGNLYIVGGGIWKVTPDQKISPLLPKNNSVFPAGLTAFAIDPSGNLYASGGLEQSSTVMKYSAESRSWTNFATNSNYETASLAAAGSSLYLSYYSSGVSNVLKVDLQTGAITTAFQSVGVGALAVGPDGTVYSATTSTILKGNPQTGVVQPFAGTRFPGYTGDGGLATQASIAPRGNSFYGSIIAVNPVNGDVAFAQQSNHVFRVITGSTQVIQTVAGTPHFAGDNNPAALARFDATGTLFAAPGLLSADSSGNLYCFDVANARIRKITPSGIVTTFAGNGTQGNSGDEGPATQASIMGLGGNGSLAADMFGNLYVASGSIVRMVDAHGIIHTVAGGGALPPINGVSATSVSLVTVYCVAVDPFGNLYISARGRILKVDRTRNLTVFAGTGTSGFSPDGTPANQAQFGSILSLAVDNSGLVYFTDLIAGMVRMVNAQGSVTTIAGLFSQGTGLRIAAAGPATSFYLYPSSLAIDAAGNVYLANNTEFGPQIAIVDTTGTLTPIAGKVPAGSPIETSVGDGSDALQSGFGSVAGLALDLSGNIYVLDSGVYIRKLSPYNPANPPPYLNAGGVIGAGASVPAVAAVSPNGDATLYGGNFGASHTLAPSDLVNGQVPTTLAGVCATFGGAPAAILGVYPSQINVQVPALPPGPVTVQVTINCGQADAITSNLSGVVVQSASPEFFTFLPDPRVGKNPIAAVDASTGVLIGAPGLLPGATFAPVKAGDIVEAYGTGWGSTTPSFGLGVLPGGAGVLALPYTLTFSGTPLPASNVLYAGVAPCCAGLYQVNFTVPSGTPSGNQQLTITVAGISSPPNAFLTVQ
jgi:uncharacterized protein (TIGR03437 family)